MPAKRRPWTRDELLVALGLYLRLPFGKLHRRNEQIIQHAALLDRTPSALAMKLTNLASLDDSLERSGLRNASSADREVWAELQADWSATANAIAEANEQLGAEPSAGAEPLPVTVDENVVTETKVRRGQALFRAAVLSAYQRRCCVTGLAEPRLLVASHIIPWADDPNHRLNPRNGLCLNALHDRAFDHGLITFDEGMRLVLAPSLAAETSEWAAASFTRYSGQPLRLPEKFRPDEAALAHHREVIFIGR